MATVIPEVPRSRPQYKIQDQRELETSRCCPLAGDIRFCETLDPEKVGAMGGGNAVAGFLFPSCLKAKADILLLPV